LVLIKLENLTKVYPGGQKEAVHELNLEIDKGEVCVLVGPSGCGKTTTLKMINRLIEPTSGKIFIDGVNAVQQDKNKLRRKIGYVIQQIGLFPHMTVKENIATVPQLLNWDPKKVDMRVEELLNLIGLDVSENIDKYPHELSGGQKQRVGVARAMAADPPIMLMDEPFGAVDPITRSDLQNELLRLQKSIKKTICFVTHDIDEAIKMGDKIAIMYEGELIQYDSPKKLLFNPKNEFVEDFIGSDRGLKVLNLMKIEEIMDKNFKSVEISDDCDQVLKKIEQSTRSSILVTDQENKLIGYVNFKRLKEHKKNKWCDFIKEIPVIEENASLKDGLNKMIENDIILLPVVDRSCRLQAIVTMDRLKSYISNKYIK